jgi:hypothetical protein
MDYNEIKAVNFSSLKYLARSPKLYKYRIDHPEPPKPEFLIGNAIHCRVLEPEEFDNRYAEWDVLTKKGDKLAPRRGAALDEWKVLRSGAEPLLPAEMEAVKFAGDEVWADPDASEVLKGCRHEEPLTWTDPETGLKCKGRVDGIKPSCVVDLKSARDPAPWAFKASAGRMLYHMQLSMYQTGATVLRKIDGKTLPYIIAVEKEPPFDVVTYQLKPEDLDAGRQLTVKLMRKLEACIEADYWPGVAPGLQLLDLPPWTPGLETNNEEW